MAEQTDYIIKELEKFTEATMKKLVVEVTANLIEETPVDTGWARANWVPQIGAPRLDPVSNPNDITSGPQERGLADVIVGYKLARGSIYITNNVPYIGRLNNGTSIQAPRAFVQSSITKAIQKVVK